ncbi:MAG TPA: cytochrome ubiquinol oxidase subunit I, partial [Gemmatimonadaceae bacterium]
MDVVLVSRLQFALTVGFHYLFPPLTIGMGVVLVYLEAMPLKTKDPLYESAASCAAATWSSPGARSRARSSSRPSRRPRPS